MTKPGHSRLRASLTALLAALLLLVSLAATSPGLHEAVHCEEDASVPHVCLLTLIRDGLFEPATTAQPALITVLRPAVTLVALPPTPEFRPPLHRLPWALSPPVI